jgi:hypothetical protein
MTARFLALFALASLVSASRPQDQVYFAFGGTPGEEVRALLGYYEGGHFVDRPDEPGDRFDAIVSEVSAKFSVGTELAGVDREGHPTRIKLEGIDEMYADDEIAPVYKVSALQRESNTPYILTSPAMDIHVAIAEKAELDPETDKTLRARATEVWRKALRRGRMPEDQASRIEIGHASVERVSAGDSKYLMVLYPITIFWSGSKRTDDRGQAFLIFSETERRVTFGSFGHPEWNSEGTGVITIRPLLYFRIGSDSRTYFLGTNTSGWESHGEFAIFEIPSGARRLSR